MKWMHLVWLIYALLGVALLWLVIINLRSDHLLALSLSAFIVFGFSLLIGLDNLVSAIRSLNEHLKRDQDRSEPR